MGELLLIPWHIGDLKDLTLRALETARRLRVFAAEHPEASRRDFARLGIPWEGKELWALPDGPDEPLLERVLRALETEDVGVLSSGGTPCLVDPGAWLVTRARARGAFVRALPGPSALTAVLSLAGCAPRATPGSATVMYPNLRPDGALDERPLAEAAARGEPVVLLVNRRSFAACLRALAKAAPGRELTAFFDLTKRPSESYPAADTSLTLPCERWPGREGELESRRVSEVALLLHAPAREGA